MTKPSAKSCAVRGCTNIEDVRVPIPVDWYLGNHQLGYADLPLCDEHRHEHDETHEHWNARTIEYCLVIGQHWPFNAGEIIVLDANGREIGGDGRKPSKWNVTTAEFETYAEALAERRKRKLKDPT